MSGSSFENDEELLTALRELRDAVYEEDPGYHTPKNIFNPAMTRTVERHSHSSMPPLKPSPSPDEHPYASLKKNHIPRWDIEALVAKEAIEQPMNEKIQKHKAYLAAKRYLDSMDFCDYALAISLVFTLILFLIGIVVLLW